MKLIEYYKEWGESEMIGRVKWFGGGLCNEIPFEYRDDLRIFKPDKIYQPYWAYDGLSKDWKKEAYLFTPLRQNIVLFICAMNDEL